MLGHRILRLIRLLRSQPPSPVIAFAWYQENQWPLLLQVSQDRDQLEKTYGEWLNVAQARYDTLVQKGERVKKVTIDVEDLFAWCRELGRQGVDAEGRSLYAVYRLKAEKEKQLSSVRELDEQP